MNADGYSEAEPMYYKRTKGDKEDGKPDNTATGWMTTLAGSNETSELELPRAWEPLDSSLSSQNSEGSSS